MDATNDAAAGAVLSTTEQMRRTIESLARGGKPSVFAVSTRALKGGSTDRIVSATPNQWLQVKCYASGGENKLHAHVHEDHTFVVLQGEVLFTGPRGEERRLTRNMGITIPKGNYYAFTVASDENLVMLRFASPDHAGDPLERIDMEGRSLDAFVEQADAVGTTRTPTEFDTFDLLVPGSPEPIRSKR
jgi:mannose-6-phosphate isomerase-like protein (cupin superfamily)